MKRDDILKRIAVKCNQLGIQQSIYSAKRRPSYVIMSVLIGGKLHVFDFYTGSTPEEVELKLGKLEGHWLNAKSGQLDIEYDTP